MNSTRRAQEMIALMAAAMIILSGCTAPESEKESRGPRSGGEHRISVQTFDGQGGFVDNASGERFTPRGMNYNRWVTANGRGGYADDVLTVAHYEPETVAADLAQIRGLGFNTVRILIDTCLPASGCTGTGPSGHGVNGGYLDNLADFLRIAGENDMVVLVASNTLPDDSWWLNETGRMQDADFQGASNEFLNPTAVPIYVDYWRGLVQGLVDRGAPLENVLGYELRQEHHFWLNEAPLALEGGLVTTANGRTYDMSIQDDKDRMIDEGLVYWADLLRDEIRSIDAGALVTVGFFTPNYPNQVQGPEELRLVRTHYFIQNASVDFVDIHHYPGNGVKDAQVWENFGIADAGTMPIVLGEYGAYRHWYPDEATAAAAVMQLEVDACRAGIDGFIVWAWRGDGNLGEYYATDGDGEIATVTAPVNRPDPCEPGTFDFIRVDLARTATASASSEREGAEAWRVNDGSPKIWNAAGSAPQWVQLDFEEPATVESIELVVAQFPSGPSVHELWIQLAGDEFRRVTVFDEVTVDGVVLRWEPETPVSSVVRVRVVTTSLPGLDPAWSELMVYSGSG
ncbi:MAG: cellulase family glycosylhydrolase [Cryobacterium sp.]|nr:cellulase family glycosylhydrolase [Cryobacterium sp.]